MYLIILVLFISFRNGLCLSFITKYKRIESLDNQICQAGNIMFNIKNIKSIGECSLLCSSRGECESISFKQSTLQCIGCDNQIINNSVMDIFDGSEFYKKESKSHL
jgi:hypothetical protein